MKNSTLPRSKFYLLVLFLLFASFSKGYSQMTAKSLTGSNGVFIGFYEFKPLNYDPSKKYPLIIFMHGIGERGNGTTDLPNILGNGLPNNIRNGHNMTFTWNGKTETFIVLMPQLSPSYGSWPAFYTDEMLKYALANFNVDEDRVYLTGLSLGGGGTWFYAGNTAANAKKFAAIGISCGTEQYVNFCNIASANLPTWAFHATNDGTVSVNATYNNIAKLNACNPAVKPYMTIWPDGDHWIWGRVYDTAYEWQNPNIYEWFLGQNRTLPVNKRPIAKGGADLTITTGNGVATLNGSASYDLDGKIVRYVWRKIGGPGWGSLKTPTSTDGIATATELWLAGTYVYEVKAIDDRADWAMDTVQVVVTDGGNINTAPTANAGSDVTLTLPTNSTTLTGTASYDKEGITSYAWSYVSGPTTYTIANPSLPVTALNNLVAGTYTFKLTVTDNVGQKSEATVKVIVNASGVNQPPTANAGSDVTITLPTSTATLNGSASVDPDGSISTYAWSYVSGPTQYTITSPAASTTTVTGLAAGTYTFKLTVTDNSGASSSATVKVVVNPAPNQSPVANAGSDVTITLPTSTATLNGSASSDPDGSIASYAWAYVSGPIQYTITSPSASTTTVTGLAAGTYTFKLTVTDNSGASSSATVKVIVNPAPNQSPVANAGSDVTITLPTSIATLNGTASSDPDGSISTYAWAYVSGPTQYTITSPSASTTTVTGLAVGTYTFKLTVTDNSGASSSATVKVVVNPAPNQSPVANAGSDITITLPASTATLNGSASNDPDGSIATYAWSYVSGPTQYTITSSSAVSTTVTGLAAGTYTFKLTVTDNSGASSSATVKVIVNPAPNQVPVANAGNDVTITLPTSTATLNGSASNDPDGSIVSYAWSYLSGPAQYTITSPSASSTTVTDLVQGTYVFKLTVTDNNGVSASATVNVVVNNPANQLPVANAGSDVTITLPISAATLNGSASNDPDGSIISYTWSYVSGPAQYTITSPSASSTTITGLTAGTYTFKLTVTDNSGASASATVKIIVNAAPNQVPVASAGNDATITLPTNSVTLNGSGSTDFDGLITSYVWTYVSGPAQYTITSPSAAATTVTGLVEGTYTFKLTVTDNSGASASATVKVIVNAAPNQVPVASVGNDVTITLPTSSVTLNGSASNDPDGSITSYTWSYVSGPAQYTITSPSTAATTVTGLVEGTYTFKLTVTDNSGASASATVKVIVNAAPNQVPVASAGNDATITLPTNSVTLNGSGSTDFDGLISSYIWTYVSGPAQYTITSPSAAATTVTGLVEGTYTFKLTVTDNSGASASATVKIIVNAAPNQVPVASAGNDVTITLPTNSATLNGSGSTDFDGLITSYVWTYVSGPAQYTITSPSAAATTVTGLVEGTYTFKLTVTDNSGASASATVKVIVNTIPNQVPVANAGNDITITLPANSVTLNGSGSTDFDGLIASYVWTYVSGPGQYTIANANTASATLSNLVEGSYVFKLTVTDNQGASGTANITITVLPAPNKAPIANAGNDTTVNLPNPVIRLNATASYDPDGQIVSYGWTRISGPGALTIVNSTTATPTVVGVQVGTYVFELTVTDDKGATAKDQVTVTVLAQPNSKPVAIAGKDTTIGIPSTSAILNGSKSYDPDGTITAYSWKQVNGPAPATIASADKAVSTVSNLQPGVYTFELTVTDNNGVTAKDSVEVTLVNNLRNEERLLVYPNPVTSITNMRLRCLSDTLGNTKVTIFDMHGKLIRTFSTYKSQSYMDIAIPVTSLLSGIYYIEVNIDNKKKMITKFVKQ
ncbi:MAG: PKD domain-containing protein [Chitinophagaceae bacterium]